MRVLTHKSITRPQLVNKTEKKVFKSPVEFDMETSAF